MILNLAYPDKSQIKFTRTMFPDGQQTIDLNSPDVLSEKITRAGGSVENNTIQIYSRFESFKDLELIICANQALLEFGCRNIHLYTPYFLGARSDRKFQNGGINYLKTVICPIINSQNFKSVTVLDPHSDVIEACLNNFVNISNLEFARNVILKQPKTNDIVLVSPDAGAIKKVFKIQQEFGIENIIIGSKNRDIKGQITHTSISGMTPELSDKTFVIFDDICDGGRTFIELAKVIKEEYANAKIVLAITHGLFTKGIDAVAEYFDHIYTTDSIIARGSDENFTTLKVYE
jgi:ribose-phosphate pyrophosphokinase